MSGLPLLLIGAGGHAVSCVDVIECEGTSRVVGFLGSRDEVGRSLLGYPVLGHDEDLPRLVAEYRRALVVVGQIKTSETRQRLFERARELGAELTTVVSPRAYVSRHAKLGAGTIVMHGAVVNAGATVGENCIINSMALVEHGATVGDHCHIATAAVINGDASIGRGTFVGSHSTVRQCLRVGEGCVIGMGQHVLKDCADGARLPATKGSA